MPLFNFFELALLEQSQCAIFSKSQVDDLEKFADKLLNKWGIDVEFSRHFADRLSDSRNTPCIKLTELQQLFKKINQDYGEKIKKQTDHEAVLLDLQSNLNLPFVIEVDSNKNLQVTMKTIIRKVGFKTPNPIVSYN